MSELTLVRATIQMVGVNLDEHVLVDTEDPEIKVYLDKGYLVPVASNARATYVNEVNIVVPAADTTAIFEPVATDDDPFSAARAEAFAAPADSDAERPRE